jgi:aspartate carbamoyltransferase catalytic subunit
MSALHFLDTISLSPADIIAILDEAQMYVHSTHGRPRPSSVLADTRIVLAFFEASTRTRMSFELAAHRLGANTYVFQPSSSSVEKGETLRDTLRTLHAMGFDAVVLRHGTDGLHRELASTAGLSIVNAGEGSTAHPTQALLDASTLTEHWGSLAGKRICIVGDVKHSRVARSNMDVYNKLGAEVAICGPDELVTAEHPFHSCMRFDHIDQAIEWADCINLLRIQRERISGTVVPSVDAYRARYAMTLERAMASPEVIIIHPGPVNINVEIDEAVLDLPQTLIDRQVTHGVAVRMAVLRTILAPTSTPTSQG